MPAYTPLWRIGTVNALAESFRNGLFGSCGVRGIVGETIVPEVVTGLARAFARHMGAGTRVAVGRDTRRSGPELEALLTQELARCGVDVTSLGVVSTPALYFLTRELGFDGGAMVTASHNPPEYNGFKFCDREGMIADQEAIAREYFCPTSTNGHRAGRSQALDGADLFFSRLQTLCPPPLRKLKLVVDCACGPNSTRLPDFLRSQGHQVLERNCIPDVEQCDRVVEPMAETLQGTIAYLRDNGADGGLCLDGDNDRLVFLDREGWLGFQQANAAMSWIVLPEAHSREVVGTVETGRYVEEAVKRAGGSLHRTVVGDVEVARVVKQRGAALGVEECGHYILPRIGHFSSTVYPATLLLAKQDLNAIRPSLAQLPRLFAADRRLGCPEHSKPDVMARVAEGMRDLGGQIVTIDGVRVDWDHGWLLVRPSGTSPYMKVNAEAFSEEQLGDLVSLGTHMVLEALQ